MIFSVIQDVLILPPDNEEFPLTILLGLAAIAAFPVIYLIVSYVVLVGNFQVIIQISSE